MDLKYLRIATVDEARRRGCKIQSKAVDSYFLDFPFLGIRRRDINKAGVKLNAGFIQEGGARVSKVIKQDPPPCCNINSDDEVATMVASSRTATKVADVKGMIKEQVIALLKNRCPTCGGTGYVIEEYWVYE